ncbi:MAG: HNH endonuclease [Campylobacterota bacterium]|nr:HNH endonuclease [Campylobacterota bacterium]
MIKVEKNLSSVPTILQSQNREDAFNQNLLAQKYAFGKTLYKTSKVQKALNNIYHLKCAFCEQKLLDSPKHIEHYRPKATYYWLSYSWDNLLLACGSCNSSKGDRFKVKNSIVTYNNETYSEIHSLGVDYDSKEEPFIINPEKDDIIDAIEYQADAKVFSKNKRVQHTIEEACKLNRDELVQKRLPVLNDFINQINKHYTLYKKEGGLSRFRPDIEIFLEKVNKQSEFYSFRYFIINNIEVFFTNVNIQKILKALILKVQNER